MNRKTLVTLGITVLIVVVIGVVITRLQGSPGAILPLPGANAPSEKMRMAGELMQSNQLEQAFQLYSEAIEEGEDAAAAHARRGDIYMQWRRFDEAALDYSAALKIARSAEVLASRCNTYRLLAKFDLATNDCNEAIELNPEYIDGYVALAFLYLERRDFENAQATIEKGLTVNPDSAQLHYVLSQVELNQGHTDKAIAEMTEAIRLDPDEPQFYWDRGFAYYVTGKLPEAKADMQSVIDVGNPEKHGELIYQAGSLLKSLSGVP